MNIELSRFKLSLKVEIRPQAYEWIIATSAGFPFMNKVHSDVMGIFEVDLPPRVKILYEALRSFYDVALLCSSQFIVK